MDLEWAIERGLHGTPEDIKSWEQVSSLILEFAQNGEFLVGGLVQKVLCEIKLAQGCVSGASAADFIRKTHEI